MQTYNGTILLVDDEAMVRDSLSEWLQMEEYQVQTAANGEEALQLCKARSYDIGVFDVRMPGMDGITLLGKVREICPDMPVVIMTAYATIESAVECIQKGAYDYVIKPFPPEKLSLLVSQIRQLQRLQATESGRMQQLERMKEVLQGFRDTINLGIYLQSLPLHQLSAILGVERPLSGWGTPSTTGLHLPSFLYAIGEQYRAEVQVSQLLPNVLADPVALYWVVHNGLDNARRAAGDGTVAIESGMVDTRRLFIKVSNSGPLVGDPEQAFQPFYSKWQDGQGQGLGLWVMRHLVQQMNGKAEIKTTADGTILQVIYLPIDHE